MFGYQGQQVVGEKWVVEVEVEVEVEGEEYYLLK